MAATNQYAGKTHCRRGHAFTAENTRQCATGARACKACAEAARRVRRARERDVIRLVP